ncbi:MAG TPA: aminoacyl-tRNA hydrolase [Candidatus Saccharimonadales bacterium]|nr:aminoacyl-tRNA hydrolase [Candidatus Saccharimonadales bacterium]
MLLIAGLGNPGPDYAATRHNIGFVLVERLAARWNAGWDARKRFNARLARLEREGQKVILCQPQTFMNASGEAVGAVARFYQLPPARTLIVLDDADLALGQIRLRPEGSSGGHHGLESIERQLGTRAYPRLRLGIGRRAGDDREITDYVLGRFSTAELKVMEEVLDRACQQVECWLSAGIQAAMNRFNGAVTAPPDKGKK